MHEYTAVAFCAIGAEKVVSNELKKLSSNTILESNFGRVRFKTNAKGLYRALFSLRAADRLLLETGMFPAPDFDSLFESVSAIPLENFIPRGMALKVGKVRSSASRLRATTSIQAVVHKAAAQRLCNHYGILRLPDAQDNGKQAELRVFVEKDKASVLLDLSGDPLFKRGYRPGGGIAPLRETTAAAIILLAGWRRKFPLYDPFCGSGTIIIEAALYAWDQAPGIGRDFAISSLAIADKTTEETIRKELTEKIDYSRPLCIQGSDADEKVLALARANLRRAQVYTGNKIKGVEFNCLHFKDAAPAKLTAQDSRTILPEPSMPGHIITNPPYGIRIGETEEAEARYAEMAELGKTFSGWKLALVCNHKGFESHFGRKADNCRAIKSGVVDTWLYQYDNL